MIEVGFEEDYERGAAMHPGQFTLDAKQLRDLLYLCREVKEAGWLNSALTDQGYIFAAMIEGYLDGAKKCEGP